MRLLNAVEIGADVLPRAEDIDLMRPDRADVVPCEREADEKNRHKTRLPALPLSKLAERTAAHSGPGRRKRSHQALIFSSQRVHAQGTREA